MTATSAAARSAVAAAVHRIETTAPYEGYGGDYGSGYEAGWRSAGEIVAEAVEADTDTIREVAALLDQWALDLAREASENPMDAAGLGHANAALSRLLPIREALTVRGRA